LWTIDISSGIFENSQNFFIVGRVSPEVFEAQNVGGPVVWRSDVFPISGDDSLDFPLMPKQQVMRLKPMMSLPLKSSLMV
jgi:hypothetical protein